MTFKMRSGNKVSFKNMGGSPAQKVVNIEDSGLEGGTPDIQNYNKQKEYEKMEAKNLAKLEKKYTSGTLKDLRDYNISEEQKSSGGRVLTEGVDVTDDDINQYKSKEQLKQDKKTRKLTSKLDERGDEEKRDYTREEKRSDKDDLLADKLQRAKGTGSNTMTFDIRNALLGGSLGAGLTLEAKHKVLQRKIDKRAKKALGRKAKEKGKTDRDILKAENIGTKKKAKANTNSYRKDSSSLIR